MAETYWDLFLGYTAIWALISGALLVLMREQRRQRRALEELEKHLHGR